MMESSLQMMQHTTRNTKRAIHDAALQKGDFIDQIFKVQGILGRGGFGIVYLVYSHETKSVYALKTFRDEYLKNVAKRDRFRREANIWVDLRHPYVVRAYLVVEIAGKLYIGMEHIAPNEQGLNSLDGYLKHRPPDLAQSLRWAIQCCHGIEYAYSRGIRSHRDIKSKNIMISQDKTAKISDFGLASVMDTALRQAQDTTLRQAQDTAQAIHTDAGHGPALSERVGVSDQTEDGKGFGLV
jgi:serine/threonine protein kinase